MESENFFVVNSSALMVIGGWGGSAALSTVEVLDVGAGVWRSGPPLAAPSYGHACLRTEMAGREGVLVTGGALTGTIFCIIFMIYLYRLRGIITRGDE
jgi:hypothetical protein